MRLARARTLVRVRRFLACLVVTVTALAGSGVVAGAPPPLIPKSCYVRVAQGGHSVIVGPWLPGRPLTITDCIRETRRELVRLRMEELCAAVEWSA